MKKILYSLFLIILVAGVSGCMKQPVEKEKKNTQENNANAEKMLSYVKDKYDREFTKVKYIPAKRGFNDFMNESVLVAKANDGVFVNVKERVGERGEFYDDYLNAHASKLLEGKVDFSGIKNLRAAKAYATLEPESSNLKSLEVKTLSYDMLSNWYSVISIAGEPDEEVLKQLYSVYEKNNALGYGVNVFLVAFGGDKDKAENYVNNYLLYGTQQWEQYDKSVNGVLRVTKPVSSFDQFKAQLTKAGG